MDPLAKARVGRTRLEVTRMGLGTAPLGGLFEDVPEQRALAIVRRALELGINFLDTAPLYGHGKSEAFLARALHGVPRDSYVLATKVGRLLCPEPGGGAADTGYANPFDFEPIFDFSYGAVIRSFEDSLKRLDLERLDVLHIHDPDSHYDDAIHGAYPALRDLRAQGRIGAIGAGMNQAEMLARFAREGDFDCFLLAGRYTLIDHAGLRELLPLCEKKGIGIIIGGPYNSGVLATGAQAGAKFNYADAPPGVIEKVRKVESVCARHNVPMKAAALQFPLAHPAVVSVIPGARSVAELEENFALMQHPIPTGLWDDLRNSGIIPGAAPTPH